VATLTLQFRGVNAYVPHTDLQKMLVVMPNASRLGRSPSAALDGTVLPRHLPTLFDEDLAAAKRTVGFTVPAVFPGARLRLEFEPAGDRPPLDLSDMNVHVSQAWLDVGPNLLTLPPSDRTSAQVLLTTGVVSEFVPNVGGGCQKRWSEVGFTKSLVPVVAGIQVSIPNVTRVKVMAFRWVLPAESAIRDVAIYDRTFDRDVALQIGNYCAEDIPNWPRNSNGQRSRDDDFKWIYGAAVLDAEIGERAAAGQLPVPVVRGKSGIEVTDDPFGAYAFGVYGGGGGLGCECNGCVGRPKGF